MAEISLASLKATLRGTLITRDDKDAFTAARMRGWNRDLNARAHPLGFAVVSGVRDIVTTVNYCRSNNIPIAVRGKGAHSPYGMANDAVVIDLMRMTAVRVDPEKKLAFIQAGADGGDVDHEVGLHNLICICGTVSHTGFAGVALGGGLGHLSRWLGAIVDSIVGYEMVTAAGELVRVDEAKDPELFWGMRGNGASFGRNRSAICCDDTSRCARGFNVTYIRLFVDVPPDRLLPPTLEKNTSTSGSSCTTFATFR